MSALVDTANLERAVQEMAERLAGALADEFVDRARAHSSRRTGALADSITHDDPRVTSTEVTVKVEVGEFYGIYQDQGTGIFGPEGVPIRPVNAKVLRFDWPAAGGIVFARSVIGSEPTRFWQKTVEEWPEIVRSV